MMYMQFCPLIVWLWYAFQCAGYWIETSLSALRSRFSFKSPVSFVDWCLVLFFFLSIDFFSYVFNRILSNLFYALRYKEMRLYFFFCVQQQKWLYKMRFIWLRYCAVHSVLTHLGLLPNAYFVRQFGQVLKTLFNIKVQSTYQTN